MSCSRICLGLIAISVLVGCAGDHPDVGSVTGKVTLDGQPLSKATVTFQPSSGRASYGVTEDDGSYRLDYMDGVKGALIGQHKVTVRTEIPGEDGQPPIAKEKLPAKYHSRTELTADVKAGSNTFDFPLVVGAGGAKK